MKREEAFGLADERPVIGITMGDPVGVGPEIICMALARPWIFDKVRPLVIGDAGVMKLAAGITGKDQKIRIVEHADAADYSPGLINVLALSNLDTRTFYWGRPDRDTGHAMINYIERGIDMSMAGEISGLVTCPVNKTAMRLAGGKDPGHTEILARRTGTEKYAMMMAGKSLRVVLVTIHTPLKSVPAAIDSAGIETTIRLTCRSLRQRFGIAEPRIAVAGLNPHAGEEEMFGDEETRVISPAIALAVSGGINASGPHSPDTVFYHAAKGAYDAVICMYHDQGLIPFKMLHFNDGVNTTLGLPIIRTSVDHGTAYDIAGQGTADPGSFVEALEMAAEHARRLINTA
ncbi:MAG: 4-hydroxythreonine-4-phosphate dehydrogenase PdxA [Desulfobacteraceae bacterium]|nr:4-hydroxythreonine-4-phosphate dehydrogenase PdxA [Desulfobacteraceae bacterium]